MYKKQNIYKIDMINNDNIHRCYNKNYNKLGNKIID